MDKRVIAAAFGLSWLASAPAMADVFEVGKGGAYLSKTHTADVFPLLSTGLGDALGPAAARAPSPPRELASAFDAAAARFDLSPTVLLAPGRLARVPLPDRRRVPRRRNRDHAAHAQDRRRARRRPEEYQRQHFRRRGLSAANAGPFRGPDRPRARRLQCEAGPGGANSGDAGDCRDAGVCRRAVGSRLDSESHLKRWRCTRA